MVRKTNITALCLFVFILAACTGMTLQQKVDTSAAVANQIYLIADAYYQMTAPAMTPADAALWAKYLIGFKLAIQTGEGVAGYVIRWYQFQSGY